MGIEIFFLFFSFLFDWHRISEVFAPTIPENAHALGKEFSTNAPRVIKMAIKFPQSDSHKGAWVLKSYK